MGGDSNIPIVKVVLYKHGIAYIEREGTVLDSTTIDLFFKSSEMNDVLKSLTVLDLNGGIISSISYAANRDTQSQLNDVAIRLDGQNEDSLTNLLSQVKGSRVAVTTQDDKRIEGTVIGTQMFSKANTSTNVSSIVPHLNLLLPSASLVSLPLLSLKNIEFLDSNLRQDLTHLLSVLINSKKKDQKQLTIHAGGQGERTVYISYTVEAPVWKTSYRILLDDQTKRDAVSESTCLLQGWANVDNISHEDWNDIGLSLVSGLPVSFVHDLYNPRYKKRPKVEVNEETSYAPPVVEQAKRSAYGGGGQPLMAQPQMSRSSFGGASFGSASVAEARQSQQVHVRNTEVGDLFHYDITHAVTVKRSGAALVPIYSGRVEARRVVVYNPDVRKGNPMSAVLLKNTSGTSLEGGPAVVLEDENYVGEAMLDTLRPKEERMLPFSVELGCTVALDHNTKREHFSKIIINQGYMYKYYWQVQNTIYNITNKNSKNLDMILEHKFLKGYELIDTQKPYETTENFYRFRTTIEAGQSTQFTVKEKLATNESIYITNSLNNDLIVKWYGNGWIDESTKSSLNELCRLNEQKNEIRTQQQTLAVRNQSITQNQTRLRQNLQALSSSQDEERELRQRYVRQLNQEEDEIKNIENELKRLQNEEKELNDKINKGVTAIHYDQEFKEAKQME